MHGTPWVPVFVQIFQETLDRVVFDLQRGQNNCAAFWLVHCPVPPLRQSNRQPRRELTLRVFEVGAGGVKVVHAGDATRGFVVEED
jgi:hypothetical protein